MLANQSGVQDIPRQEWQERRPAARGFQIRRRSMDQAFQPNLPVMRQLCGKPIGAEQWMRQSPSSTFELA
jgi:hypothetical protein